MKETMMIADQYRRTLEELNRVCLDCGRNPSEVTLVAVSKTVSADQVAQAVDVGAKDFGENRPEQIMQKSAAYPQANWHFIGNIQSRRIHDIVPCASLIHSVYQQHHLAKIDEAAARSGKIQDILLEANVSGEQSKAGVPAEQMPELLRAAMQFPHLRVRGLMTMAPQGDKQVASECFARLRELRDKLKSQIDCADGPQVLSELSMGMSEDWREAIAQGATIVRIGRAIFSEDFAEPQLTQG